MITLLYIFLFLGLGMGMGHLFRHARFLRPFFDKCSSLCVIVLLFSLGSGLGSDNALFTQLPRIGGISLGLALASSIGSVIALLPISALFARATDNIFPIGKRITPVPPQHPAVDNVSAPRPQLEKPSAFSFKNLFFSFGIILFFILGIALARHGIPPQWLHGDRFITGLLCLLVFAVGISLGAELKVFLIIRYKPLLLLAVPVLTALGSLAGGIAFSLIAPLSTLDAVIASAGLGYYSLSSLLVGKAGFTGLAAITLLSNIIRELFGIVTPALMVPIFGRLAPVGVAATPAMDTCLPMITKHSGEQVAVCAVVSGVVLTAIAPPFLALLLLFK